MRSVINEADLAGAEDVIGYLENMLSQNTSGKMNVALALSGSDGCADQIKK